MCVFSPLLMSWLYCLISWKFLTLHRALPYIYITWDLGNLSEAEPRYGGKFFVPEIPVAPPHLNWPNPTIYIYTCIYIYIYIDGHAKVAGTSVKVYIIYFSRGTTGGVRGEYWGWSWDDRSFVNLKDNFMKFGVEVQNRVERQCQNDFSPGGPLRGDFSTLTGFGQFLTLKKH